MEMFHVCSRTTPPGWAICPVETFAKNSRGLSRTTLFHHDEIELMNGTVAKKRAAGKSHW